MSFRRDCHDHVEWTAGEVGELQLNHRTLALPRRADRGADESLLGDGRIHHPLSAELLQQAGGDLVRALEQADLFAQQHHGWIAPHLFGQSVVQGLTVGNYAHGSCPGSAAGWLATWVA